MSETKKKITLSQDVIDIRNYSDFKLLANDQLQLYIKNSAEEERYNGFNGEGFNRNALASVLKNYFGVEVAESVAMKERGPQIPTEAPAFEKYEKILLIERIEEVYRVLEREDQFMVDCFPSIKSDTSYTETTIIESENTETIRAQPTTPAKFVGMTIKKFLTTTHWHIAGTEIPIGFPFTKEGNEIFVRMLLDMALCIKNALYVVALKGLYSMRCAYLEHIGKLMVDESQKRKYEIAKFLDEFNVFVKKDFPLHFLETLSNKRSQTMEKKLNTWLLHKDVESKLVMDRDNNLNSNFGQFGQNSEVFNKINTFGTIDTINGNKIYKIGRKFITKSKFIDPLTTAMNLTSYSAAPWREDILPEKFTSQHRLPYVLDAQSGDGGNIRSFNYEDIVENSLLFDKSGLPYSLASYKSKIGNKYNDNNDNTTKDVFFSDTSALLGHLLHKKDKDHKKAGEKKRADLKTREKKALSYLSKTLRRHILKNAGISSFDDEELLRAGMGTDLTQTYITLSNVEGEEKKRNEIQGYDIKKSGIETLKTAIKKFSDEISTQFTKDAEKLKNEDSEYKRIVLENINKKDDKFTTLSEFYEDLYYRLPFSKSVILYLIQNDIDIPISWFIKREGDLVTCSAFKLADKGETLKVQYGNVYTQFMETIETLKLQLNLKVGHVISNYYGLLKFLNCMVLEISRYTTTLFKEGDNKTILNDGFKKLDDLKKSVYVIPVDYTYDFSSISYPADIRLGSTFSIKDMDTLWRFNKYWIPPKYSERDFKTFTNETHYQVADKDWKTNSFIGWNESVYYKGMGEDFLQFRGQCPLLTKVYPGCVHYLTGQNKLEDNNPLLKSNYVDLKI